MAAATITNDYTEELTEENLILWVMEGEQYYSKLSEPKIVQATFATGASAGPNAYSLDTYVEGPINATISGNVITFHTTAGGGSAQNGSGGTAFITIKGRR